MKNNIDNWQQKDNLKKRLYLLAKRKGFALQLCRKHDDSNPDHDTFRILNRTSGALMHSARPGGYGLTLAQVEEYLVHHSAKEQGGTLHAKSQRAATEGIPNITKFIKPPAKTTVGQAANPPEARSSTMPSASRTMTLAGRNVALLEVVAKNLEQAIKRDTKQLHLCRDMVAQIKNAP